MNNKKEMHKMTIEELNKDKEEYIEFVKNMGSEPPSDMLIQYEILIKLEEVKDLVKHRVENKTEEFGFYFSQRRSVEEKLIQIMNIIP